MRALYEINADLEALLNQYDPETGDITGHLRIGNITYWARYRKQCRRAWKSSSRRMSPLFGEKTGRIWKREKRPSSLSSTQSSAR